MIYINRHGMPENLEMQPCVSHTSDTQFFYSYLPTQAILGDNIKGQKGEVLLHNTGTNNNQFIDAEDFGENYTTLND